MTYSRAKVTAPGLFRLWGVCVGGLSIVGFCLAVALVHGHELGLWQAAGLVVLAIYGMFQLTFGLSAVTTIGVDSESRTMEATTVLRRELRFEVEQVAAIRALSWTGGGQFGWLVVNGSRPRRRLFATNMQGLTATIEALRMCGQVEVRGL